MENKLKLIALALMFTGCTLSSYMEEDTVKVIEITPADNANYKYRVKLSSFAGNSYILTNTYYIVGEKIKLIQTEE